MTGRTLRGNVPEGIALTVFPTGSLNIQRHESREEITRADVDATRAAFVKLGWTETESWLPRQGVSWLSDGVSAGVSFIVSDQPPGD